MFQFDASYGPGEIVFKPFENNFLSYFSLLLEATTENAENLKNGRFFVLTQAFASVIVQQADCRYQFCGTAFWKNPLEKFTSEEEKNLLENPLMKNPVEKSSCAG